MKKIVIATTFLLLACVAGFGQTSYMGLTPGQSTRADVERVLGQPVKNVSKTLVEYVDIVAVTWRIYVQYQDESPTEIVERIERTCLGVLPERCGSVISAILLEGVLEDALSRKDRPDGFVLANYYGAPRFIVATHISKGINYEARLAYYSKELYESAVPKSGCTGTIFGTWLTDRGRMTVQRVGDNGVQGTYSNNGSFSLSVVEPGVYQGPWKDNTGTGEMTLLHDRDTFSATWTGTGARVPPNETLKPREKIGGKLEGALEKIEKSGKGAAIGAIITEPSKPSLRVTGLPPGEPWKGKCVP